MMARSRAAHGQGGVYPYMTKSGDRLWRVAYSVADPDSGAIARTNKRGFATQREAIDYRAKVLADAKTGTLVRQRAITLGEYAETWVQRHRIKESTRHSYQSKLRLYVLPRLGSVKLQRLTTAQIDLLYRDLESGKANSGRPLSARSVRYTHTILRKLLKSALADRLLSVNPTDHASPPTVKEARAPEMKVWTAEQLASFLQASRDHRLYPLFVVYATTGMRRGEALGLKWADLDLDAGKVAVRRAVSETAGAVEVTTTKTGHSRVVELDSFTVAALRAHRTRQAEERLRFGPDWRDEGWVFAHSGRGLDGQAGAVLQPDSVWRAFKGAIEKANSSLPPEERLPALSVHGLRHTWATLALSGGVHHKVVQERLGHSTPMITLSTYSHVGDTLQKDAAESVAARLFG